jgi:lysophospholipase L1-like esterase
MKRYLLGSLLLISSLVTNGACVDPNQILYFTNSLLTRKCSWVDTIDLWRTTNTQYSTVFFGDSLIANGSWGAGVGNQGYGGDTVQLLLQRIDIVVAANPTDVYMLIGINDFWRGATASWIFALYNGTINILKNAGINVHVISTPHCNEAMQGATCVTANGKITTLNASLSGVSGVDFIDADALLSDAGGLKSMYTTDGIHLNNAGYAIIYGLL